MNKEPALLVVDALAEEGITAAVDDQKELRAPHFPDVTRL
jgi:hypothetical protein